MATFTYSRHGSLKNPPLVFLHGFLGHKEDWDEVISHLASRFFCLSLALPGHGSPFSTDFSQTLETTLNEHGVKSPVLIGYSMGGRLALHAMHERPTLASRAIVFSSHPGLKDDSERADRLSEELKWERLLKTLSLKEFLDRWYAQPLFASLAQQKELLTKLLERRMQHNPRGVATAMRLFSSSRQPLLAKIPENAFFVCGEEDLKYKELYRKLIPPAQVRILANCGHALHVENPLICAQTIEKYLC